MNKVLKGISVPNRELLRGEEKLCNYTLQNSLSFIKYLHGYQIKDNDINDTHYICRYHTYIKAFLREI